MIGTFDKEYTWLSNFSYSPIEEDGWQYPTVEHYFQAKKTLDKEEYAKIVEADTPGRAKRLGQKVNLRSDWEEIKTDIMRDGLRLKFQDPALRAKLLATGDEELIEGNTWHDRTWGRCVCAKCGGQGQNLLGQLLMKLREEIRNENK